MGLVTLLGLIALLRAGLARPVDSDELEHLHAAWLWMNGYSPYTQFFEHHPPLYWLLLQPLFVLTPDHDIQHLLLWARILSFVINIAAIASAGWFFAVLMDTTAGLCAGACLAMALYLLESSIHARPDMFSIALAVSGSALAVRGFGLGLSAKIVSSWRIVLGGMLLGLAICVLSKVIFWIAPILAGCALLFIRPPSFIPSRSRMLLLFILLVCSMAAPLLVMAAWVFIKNDPAKFWYCNWTINTRLSGSVLRSQYLWQIIQFWFVGWPLISFPLAACGLFKLFVTDRSPLHARFIIVCGLLVTSLLLLFLANGPWPQYEIQLMIVLCGLSGLGLLYLCTARWLKRVPPAICISLVMGGWWLAARAFQPDRPAYNLEQSLSELAAALGDAQQDDTYAAFNHFNPVYMKDANPNWFMGLTCAGDDGAAIHGFMECLRSSRPHFILSPAQELWTAKGEMVRVPLPDDILSQYQPYHGDLDFLIRKEP